MANECFDLHAKTALTLDAPNPEGAGRRRIGRPLRIAMAVALVAATVAGGLYVARRMLAREAITGWLEAHGVQGDVTVERFDFNAFTGKVRVGPANAPDLTIDRVEAIYALRGFWVGRPFGLDLSGVRLVRPIVKGRLHGGVMTFGALDPLVEELRKIPPDPDARKPLVLIENGKLFLETDVGAIGLRGEGRVEDGRLTNLSARLDPTRITHENSSALIDGGRLNLVAKGPRLDFSAAILLAEAQAGQAAARRGVFRVDGSTPYPDIQKKQGDGAFILNSSLTGEELDWAGNRLTGVTARARFEGLAKGWIDSLSVAGPVRLSLAADTGDIADLHLSGVGTELTGKARWNRRDWAMEASASTEARGVWTGLGKAAASDDLTLAALKRAASGFRLGAPAVAVEATPSSIRIDLPTPVTLSSESGAKLVVAARDGSPVYADGAGAFGVAAEGGGLPQTRLVVDRYRASDKGATASLSGSVEGDFGPVRGGLLRTSGALVSRGGTVTYAARGCDPLKAAEIELGDTDVHALDAMLCPGGGPLLTLNRSGWSAQGKLDAASLQAPSLQVKVAGLTGAFDVGSGAAGSLAARFQLADAEVTDTAPQTRFRRVRAKGEGALANERLTGLFDIAAGSGEDLGAARLDADLASGAGRVSLDTGPLFFAQDGLQPGAISPLAAPLGGPVVGQVRFEGGFKWAGKTSSSDGLLRISDLNFKSGAGAVSGLSGDLTFVSLDPVRTAPGQVLTVAKIETLAVLTDVRADFQLDGDQVKIASADVATGGGRLRLDPTTARLDTGAISGVVNVDGVQLKDVVERSPFADHVAVDAKVSGRLPFSVRNEAISITNGRLEAIQPGRISISRDVLSGVKAEGGAAANPEAPVEAQTNTVTEFAFQALEHLSFESLSAEVNSLPAGRLGVLFKIKGEHAPPTEQVLRVGVMDLVRGDILNRKLPLPSHTKVDLTLDTSVNLDQILADFARTQRVGGSAPVQP